MDFQIGSQVVHWSYGLGEVIDLEEKELSGKKVSYYVVKIGDLTLWVPVDDVGKASLRFVTPAGRFERLFEILSSPGEPLSTDRMERKTQLTARMRAGDLDSICEVLRDLTLFKQTQKMNDQDHAIMKRAEAFLITEWTLSQAISPAAAEEMLKKLLAESLARSA